MFRKLDTSPAWWELQLGHLTRNGFEHLDLSELHVGLP